jgi:hypothetical protein
MVVVKRSRLITMPGTQTRTRTSQRAQSNMKIFLDKAFSPQLLANG